MATSLKLMPPDLSVVLPAFNEEVRLPKALRCMSKFASDNRLAMQVVVVDDGSTDGTVGVVRDWQNRSLDGLEVRLVKIAHRGKGAAVRAGMGQVTAPIVGYCDVDLSAGADALQDALSAIHEGAEMVMASRALPESVLEIRQPWYRERAGRTFNFFLRKLSGVEAKDTQCGLKLFRHEVARLLFRHQRLDGFAFDAELVLLAVRLGFEVKEIPVRWAHDEDSKVSLVRDSVRMSMDMLRIMRRLGRGSVHALGIPSKKAMEMMTTSEDAHWWYVAKRRLITACLDGHDGMDARCLDVGCGGGGMLAELAGKMPVFGLDLSRDALSHARNRGLTMLASGEAAALPFADGSFSAVLALDVLEHHARPEELLQEVNRVLDKNGVLIVTVPAFQWMWSYADHVLGHYRRYTKGRLSQEVAASGLVIERVSYFHSWLLPIAWIFRKLRTLTRRTDSADDFKVPQLLNRFLLEVSSMEMRLLGRYDMPFGLSVLGIARSTGPKTPQPINPPADEAVML